MPRISQRDSEENSFPAAFLQAGEIRGISSFQHVFELLVEEIVVFHPHCFTGNYHS